MLKNPNFRARQAAKTFGRVPPIGSSGPATALAEGLKHHQAGRLHEAEKIYIQVLTLHPDHFDSRHLLGISFLQRGRHEEALHHIDLALKVNPSHAPALNNRGVALQELKRFDEALQSFERALSLKADFADAHSNRANIFKSLGRYDEALAGYDRALALRPDNAEAHSNRADALNQLKRFDEALASCDRALTLQSGFAQAHTHRASALNGLRRFDEALSSNDRSLALRPNHAATHSNRGNTLCHLRRFEDAIASHDAALALRPDFAEAYSNRGNALQKLGRFEEALDAYDRAIRLQRDFAEVHLNRGNVLMELSRHDEAVASFDRAVALKPDFADAHANAALCLLLTGELRRGWQRYEWRWRSTQLKDSDRKFNQPQWIGTDIADKTILLHAEQGLGDTIQFGRYVPDVAARAKAVILEVQRPLLDLMSAFAGGNVQIIAAGDPRPDFELHCPLLSLPLAFGTQLASIPGATPYFSAAAAKSSRWRDRLGAHARPRIGLVWAGDPRKQLPDANEIDRQRSIAFDVLTPLFAVTECDFYSLQKGEDAVAQLRNSGLRHRVIDWSDDFHDFSDTAALIDNLDLVIAVDTSVAHLAGALGKPLWLLNRYNTCWRWLLDRNDSPWYPTVRLFRQDTTRNWEAVIGRVAAALQSYVSGSATDRGISSPAATESSGAYQERP